jgi:hypothetical protein
MSANTMLSQPTTKHDEIIKLDNYYQDLMRKERNETGKILVAKLACQRMDLERQWSKYFKEAERKLKKA